MRPITLLSFCIFLTSSSVFSAPREAIGTLGPVEPASSMVSVIDTEGHIRETVAGTSIFTLEHILPKQGQTVGLALKDGSEITVATGSDLSVSDYSPGNPDSVPHTELNGGSAHFNVSKTTTGKTSFYIHTNSAVMGVRGTEFVVDQAADGTSNLHTLQGEVAMAKSEKDLATPGRFTTVGPGRMSFLRRSMNAPAPAQSFNRKAYLAGLSKTHPGLARRVRPEVKVPPRKVRERLRKRRKR